MENSLSEPLQTGKTNWFDQLFKAAARLISFRRL
jgi:hypothetical protein